MPRIVADLHCHTVASAHAYSTVKEIVETCAAKGLSAVAITDHGPALPDSPHLWHFDNQRILPRCVGDVRLLRGAEVSIVDFQGGVDLDERMLRSLDWTIASFHGPACAPGTPEDHTAAYLALISNPLIDVLGHTGSVEFPYDVETVVKACAAAGKCMEINVGSFRVRPTAIPNCRRIADACRRHGALVVVDSDAHTCWDVGEFGPALDLLDSVGFPEERILNADLDRLERYLAARTGRAPR